MSFSASGVNLSPSEVANLKAAGPDDQTTHPVALAAIEHASAIAGQFPGKVNVGIGGHGRVEGNDAPSSVGINITEAPE
jgi:hypothetical protein